MVSWYETDRTNNVRKYGLDFIDIAIVFDGALIVESPKTKRVLGFIEVPIGTNHIVVLKLVSDGNGWRIISARPAKSHEKGIYHTLYSAS